MGALREQSLTHVKERVALKAILDDKVRALISDIGQSVAELPIEVRCPGRARGTCPPAFPQSTVTLTKLPIEVRHLYVCRSSYMWQRAHLPSRNIDHTCMSPIEVRCLECALGTCWPASPQHTLTVTSLRRGTY